MPTAVPVLELIRQDILLAISKIRLVNGYTFDAIQLEPDRLGEQTGDGVVVVTLGESREENMEANALVQCVQEFLFAVQVAIPENVPGTGDRQNIPWDGIRAQRAADIQKALQVDYTRGGNAHDTLPEPPAWWEREQGTHEGCTARCYVRYRFQGRLDGGGLAYDPYTVR